MTELFLLFISFIQVGMFSVGGGYAAVPLIEAQVVSYYGWLSIDEFTNLITIAEMTPGPIAVNCATFVGLRLAGIPGAIVATFGCILPSLVIVSLLAYLYARYHQMKGPQIVLGTLRPAVVALIAAAFIKILLNAVFAGYDISLANADILSVVLFIGAFVAIRYLKWRTIPVMAGCGIIYMIVSMGTVLFDTL